MDMEFRVLGPIEVAAGGRVATPGRGHRHTILALLLAAGGEVVSNDALIAGLWGEQPPTSARKSLQSHLSRLRTELADVEPASAQPVVSEPHGYRLDLERHDLDASRFLGMFEEASHKLDGEPAKAADLLSDGLSLWRGPAYGQLRTHDGVRADAARLDQARTAAEADLVDARLALGQHELVVGDLLEMVAQQPLAERTHRQLILALYRSGRQGQALRTYEQLRRRLRDELGVDPSPTVRSLHLRILEHDPTLMVPPASDGTPHRAPGGPVRSQPSSDRAAPASDDLVGREADLTHVVDHVASGRLLTLTGPGGVGKTRLAERVTAIVGNDFSDGTALAELAAVRAPQAVAEALVTTLGIQPTGDQPIADVLVDALADRHLLLVLDNCEHLISTIGPLVAAILSRCPSVGLLATSRERLRVPGEQLWQVAPLAVPASGADPEEVLATPAGRLLQMRATAADPSFAITEENASAVTELCRRLDGMPLAIELAAARLRAMTPADLVDRLDQRFSLLAGGPHHEAGRHRTLRAVVAWSYDLLSPAEARLFDRLSVFAGRFSLTSAEQVCAGDSIEVAQVAGILAELVDKSMVVATRHPTGVQYRLLDTLREFGQRRLAEVDDPPAWHRRHADHHVDMAERLGPRVRGPDEPAAVAAIGAAFDDLRAAHAWLLETGDTSRALRIPAALGEYLFYRLRDEVTTWARRALEQSDADDDPAHVAALTTAAYGATSRTECDRAREEAERALHAAPPGGLEAVRARVALGTAALYDGRLDDLLADANELSDQAAAVGEPFYTAFAGVLRVLAHAYRDRPDAARGALRDLESAADASGNPTMRAFARYCRGEVQLETDPSAAAEALEEAVQLAREVDNALIEGVSRVSLASLRGRLGQTDQALQQFRDVIAHWRRLGDHTHQLTTLRNLVVLLAQSRPDEEVARLHAAVTVDVTPSFGLEAQRLADAWQAIERRLGPTAAERAASHGRELTSKQASELALRHIDELLAS